MDEQDLIARAQRGDVDAFTLLVRRYQDLAFRVAWLILRDPSDAQDATQEAFVRAHRALATFRKEQPLRPWLLKIVTNQAYNRIQAGKRRAAMHERLSQDASAAAIISPEREALTRERAERLLQAVEQLSTGEKDVISLRYFLDLSEAEMAEILGVPRGTVKSRLSRALARLRELIRRDFPDLESG